MSSHPEANHKWEQCKCNKDKKCECRENTPKIFCQSQGHYIDLVLCYGKNCILKKYNNIRCEGYI